MSPSCAVTHFASCSVLDSTRASADMMMSHCWHVVAWLTQPVQSFVWFQKWQRVNVKDRSPAQEAPQHTHTAHTSSLLWIFSGNSFCTWKHQRRNLLLFFADKQMMCQPICWIFAVQMRNGVRIVYFSPADGSWKTFESVFTGWGCLYFTKLKTQIWLSF